MGEAEVAPRVPVKRVGEVDPWRENRGLGLAIVLFVAFSLVAVIVGVLGGPQPLRQETDVKELGGGMGWVSLGIMIGSVFLGWAFTGVPIMGWNWVLHKFRVDIHNWISIIALGIALFHSFELMAVGRFEGWLSGWIANAFMFALFITGWWRVPLVRRWSRPTWRIVHWELAIGAIAFSVAHWQAIEIIKGG